MSGNAADSRHVEVAVDGAAAQVMPVAEMRGLDDPATQTRYGNNVPKTPGAHMVTFTVNGQTGTFTVGQ